MRIGSLVGHHFESSSFECAKFTISFSVWWFSCDATSSFSSDGIILTSTSTHTRKIVSCEMVCERQLITIDGISCSLMHDLLRSANARRPTARKESQRREFHDREDSKSQKRSENKFVRNENVLGAIDCSESSECNCISRQTNADWRQHKIDSRFTVYFMRHKTVIFIQFKMDFVCATLFVLWQGAQESIEHLEHCMIPFRSLFAIPNTMA